MQPGKNFIMLLFSCSNGGWWILNKKMWPNHFWAVADTLQEQLGHWSRQHGWRNPKIVVQELFHVLNHVSLHAILLNRSNSQTPHLNTIRKFYLWTKKAVGLLRSPHDDGNHSSSADHIKVPFLTTLKYLFNHIKVPCQPSILILKVLTYTSDRIA